MQIYLNVYGTYIRVKNNMLEIRRPRDDGSVKKYLIAPHKIKSIILGKGVLITSNAMALALENNIDIVIMDNYGYPMGRVWYSGLGSTTLIRRKQLQLKNSQIGIDIIKDWIKQKLDNQIDFLQKLARRRKKHQEFLSQQTKIIHKQKEKIQKLKAKNIDEIAPAIRGLEGAAGRIYFSTLSQLLDKRYRFEGRSFRPAKDPFNAFLNYAYGILYARVEKALIIAGIEPYMGILHRDDYNRKSMVYDFIEPYRIWADQLVFKLFAAKKVNKTHVDQIPNGVILNDKGKKLLIEPFIEFLDTRRIRFQNRLYTPDAILIKQAHNLANKILKINIL